MAKDSATTTGPLYLNNAGGLVYVNNKKVVRLTSDPTSGQVMIADGTDGQIKSSGKTIATSITNTDDTLPTSKAVKTFVEGKGYVTTDEKVKQSTNSEAKNFPLLFSKAETSNTTADITDSVYRNNSIYINPSTKQIFVDNNAGSQWKKGRETASLIKTITPTSYSPITDIKSTSGDWSIGTVNNTENLYLVYTTDDNYSGSGNKALKYYLEGADSTNSYAILHSGNYNSYSPTLTGTGASGDWGINAATATKATQDSDGNTIKTTYLKLSGGTVTGTINIKSSNLDRDGEAPTSDQTGKSLYFVDKDSNGVGRIYTIQRKTNNKKDLFITVYNASGTSNSIGIRILDDGTPSYYLSYPSAFRTALDNAAYIDANTITNNQVIIADGTDGKLKSSGFTIESSVPSDAVFTDEKLRLNALSAPATGDEKAYYVAFKGAGLNTGYYNNGFLYRTLDGAAASGSTAAVDGYSTLQLGNATASGTDGNRFGRLRIYSKGTKYGALIQGDTTGNVTHTLPATSGTILNSGNYDDYVSPLLQATVGHSCKNLLKITATSTTKNGVTFNVNSTTGIITATGKSSANFYYTVGSIVNTDSTAMKLYMSGCANDGSTDTYYVYAYDISASPSARPKQWDNSTQSESCTFLTDDEEILIPAGHTVQIRIYIKTNYPGQNTTITFKPMVRDGNILNNTFEPYQTPTDEAKQDKLQEYISTTPSSSVFIDDISNLSYFIVNIVYQDSTPVLGPDDIYSVFISMGLLDSTQQTYFHFSDNNFITVYYTNSDTLVLTTNDNNYKIKSIVYFYK